MKLYCDKNYLNEAINIVQKAIQIKNPNPILDCIKIDAEKNGNLKLTGNNLELCIEFFGMCNVPDPGSVALSSKIFGEIVRKLPDGTVTLSVNESNNVTTISCQNSEFNIQGLYTEEYPEPPEIEERYRFTISEEVLKNIIRKTIPFTAMSEGSKPAQIGVLFEIEKGVLTAVSSDGKRVAVIKENIESDIEKTKFIIPGNTLRELIKILKDENNQITVVTSPRHVLFDCGNYKVFTRLIEGDFLKYAPIIAAPNTIFVEIENRVITNSLERALLIINEDDSGRDIKIPVKFNIDADRMEVSSLTGKGKVYDVVPANVKGNKLTVGFNCKFMLDALRVCDGEMINMEFSTPNGGCFIKSVHDTGSETFLILPVKLNN